MINELIKTLPINTNMLNEKHVRRVLSSLEYTLKSGVPGDVVELGCNYGNMAMFIQSMLTKYGSKKQYHVYDSFEGLPEPVKQDFAPERTANRGDLAATVEGFKKTLSDVGVKIPIIHKGWFNEAEYPQKISFAFLDGDFYQSIMDSWQAVFPRLSPGAIVCVHDYGFPPLPGAQKATDEFLSDKYHIRYWDDYVFIAHF